MSERRYCDRCGAQIAGAGSWGHDGTCPRTRSEASDCRSDAGVIVGLIDGMIAQARIVAEYLRVGPVKRGIADALDDIRADEDMAYVLTAAVGPGGADPKETPDA